MAASVFHVTLASAGRRTLARGEDEVRCLVRAVVRPCCGRLLLFSVVDEHIHLVVLCKRPRLLARDVVRSIRRELPGVEFQPAHVTPIETRKHLERLVGYLLRQPSKHGLPVHPALWSGSCFQDLAGVRLLPGYERSALLAELPRLRLGSLMQHVGLPASPVEPADDRTLRLAGPSALVDLAAGVLAVPCDLRGRRTDVVRARTIAVQAAAMVGLRPSVMAPFLPISERATRRLAALPLDGAGVHTLRRRLTLQLRAGGLGLRGGTA